MKTNTSLCKFAKDKLGCGYVWGTFGQILTESVLHSKAKQYPTQVGTYKNYLKKHLGTPTCDCIGLIKWFFWQNKDGGVTYQSGGMADINANMLFDKAQTKGTIKTMPEIKGLAVWRRGHIGIYIGNGYVIEAKGTRYGVVKSKLSDCSFTHWCKIPGITYRNSAKKSKKFKVGQRVIVSGVGNASSDGSGGLSRKFTGTPMVILAIKPKAKYPYACSIMLGADSPIYTTAWFKEVSIK